MTRAWRLKACLSWRRKRRWAARLLLHDFQSFASIINQINLGFPTAGSVCTGRIKLEKMATQVKHKPSFKCDARTLGGPGYGSSPLFGTLDNFRIPPFQRSYAWGETQIKRLLNDFALSYKEELLAFDYLGNIICWQKTPLENEPDNWLLDGQQRVTTFMVFWAVARHVCIELDRKGYHSYWQDEYTQDDLKGFLRHKDKTSRLQLRDQDLQTWFEKHFLHPAHTRRAAHDGTGPAQVNVNSDEQHAIFMEFIQMANGPGAGSQDDEIGPSNFLVSFRSPKTFVRHETPGTPKARLQFVAAYIYQYLYAVGKEFDLSNFLEYIRDNATITVTTMGNTPDEYITSVRSFFMRLNDTGLVLSQSEKVKVELVTSFPLRDQQTTVAREWERLEDKINTLGHPHMKNGLYHGPDGKNSTFEYFLTHLMDVRDARQRNEPGFYAHYMRAIQSPTDDNRASNAKVLWAQIQNAAKCFMLLLDPTSKGDQLEKEFPAHHEKEFKHLRIILLRMGHMRLTKVAQASREWHPVALCLMLRYWECHTVLVDFMLQLEKLLVHFALAPKSAIDVNARLRAYFDMIKAIQRNNADNLSATHARSLQPASPANVHPFKSILKQRFPADGPKLKDYVTSRSLCSIPEGFLTSKHVMEAGNDDDDDDDDESDDDIEFGVLYDDRAIKYLLLLYESFLSGFHIHVTNDDLKYGVLSQILIAPNLEIEHIYPQSVNRTSPWNTVSWDDRSTNALGNLTILEGEINKKCSNLPFRAQIKFANNAEAIHVTKKQKRETMIVDPKAGKLDHYLGVKKAVGSTSLKSVTSLFNYQEWTAERFLARHNQMTSSIIEWLRMA